MILEELVFHGIPIAKGIGIGNLYLLPLAQKQSDPTKQPKENASIEIKRYREAVKSSVQEVKALQKQLKEENAQEAVDVLSTHLELLDDPIFTSQVESEVRKNKLKSLNALQTILASYERQFQGMLDPFFRERFRDIQDVSERVMKHLGKKVRQRLDNLPEGIILFAYDLTPSEIASILPGSVKAIVTERGGATSHTAIIAKAKGIPYVSQLALNPKKLKSGTPTIVDGTSGKVIVSPHVHTLESYFIEIQQLALVKKEQKKDGTPPKTADGETIQLSINVDTLDDLPDSPIACGLFRTEFLLSEDNELPTEDEQFTIYKEILERLKGKPVVIRAFDLGGDKGAILKEHHTEENPALGLRAIRLLLQELPIFKKQVRALLRAAPHGQLKLLIPMITSVEEILETKKIIRELKKELEVEGLPSGDFIGLGCMIEVPSAALILEDLSSECEFFSIGTNDLMQFLLAVDRNKPQIVPGASPFHPAMVRLLKTIVDGAKKMGTPLSICGEIASDPKAIPLLIGLGIRELSVGMQQLPMIRALIQKISASDARLKVEQSLKAATTAMIQDIWR